MLNLRIPLSLIFFFIITADALAQTNPDETILRHLKTVEWPKAYREQDTVLLDRILAEEFEYVDENGNTTTKRDELDYIKQHKPGYTSFVYTIDRLDIFENGTAIVSGTGRVLGVENGIPYEMTYKSTNVLIKRAGQWKAVNSHVSGIKQK